MTYYIPAEQVKKKGFKLENPGNRCLIVLFECIGKTPLAKKIANKQIQEPSVKLHQNSRANYDADKLGLNV